MGIDAMMTEVTITGISLYGLALLFAKGLVILLMAQSLADQFELSPASIRHTIWLVALACMAALPLLTIVLPAWYVVTVDLSPASVIASSAGSQTSLQISEQASSWSIFDYLAVVYVSVAAARFLVMISELVKVGVLTAKAEEAGDDWYTEAQSYYAGRLKIKQSAHLEGPVTWGTLYPVILLPDSCGEWTSQEREIVLRHEIGHIRRADWLAQLLSAWVAILYWPVPGVRRAIRSLSLEAERACDDVVLAEGINPADYAALLLKQAKLTRLQATVALGKPSELGQRIKHIVGNYVGRAGERKTRIALSLAAACVLLPFASVQAIGRLPAAEPFAGMKLVPMVLRDDEALPAVREKQRSIVRPDRPGTLESPPAFAVLSENGEPVVQQEREITLLRPQREGIALVFPDVGQKPLTLVYKAMPEYPPVAKRRGIEGTVVVEYDVDENGEVVNPRVAEASPSRIFDRAVLKAIRAYHYQPHLVRGEPVSLQGLREEFKFQLISDKPTERASAGDTRAGQPSPNSS